MVMRVRSWVLVADLVLRFSSWVGEFRCEGLALGESLGQGRVHVLIFGFCGVGGYAVLYFGLIGVRSGLCVGGSRLDGQG